MPRYRQRVQPVPGRLANPVWVDDEHFDLGLPRTPLRAAPPRHHRAAARAGRAGSCRRPLDRAPAAVGDLLRRGTRRRPGRAALQDPPDPRRRHRDRRPRPGAARRRPRGQGARARRLACRAAPPSPPAWRLSALARQRPRPARRWSRHRPQHGRRPRRGAGRRHPRPGRCRRRRAGQPPPDRGVAAVSASSPQQRRFVTVRTDARRLPHRSAQVHGGTVNDVILATVTGALRAWLMTRAESVGAAAPAARDGADVGHRRRARADLARHPGRRPPASTCRSARPARWSGCTRSPTPSRRTRRPAAAVAANRLAGIAGFAPTTFHALGSRVAAEETRRGFHLVDHQRPRARSSRCTPPARGCSRPTRSRRCCPATRWRSA